MIGSLRRRAATGARSIRVMRPGDPSPDGNDDFVLAVPGSAAPVCGFQLPKGVAGPARLRIARQQLVDLGGQSMRGLDIRPLTLGQQSAAVWDHAIIVDQQVVKGWCSGLATDARCRAVLPEYLTLPGGKETLVIDADERNVFARIGLHDAFAAPPLIAESLLQRALTETGIRAAFVGNKVPQRCWAVLAAAGLTVQRLEDAGDAAVPERFAAGELLMDLRRSSNDVGANKGVAGALGVAAALALLSFSLWSVGIYANTRGHEIRADALRAQTEAVLRRNLLPAGPIVDMRAQVERRFVELAANNATQTGVNRLALLSRVSVVLFGKGSEVTEMGLSDEGLVIAIRAPDFATAERIEADLRAVELPVVTESARARDDGAIEAQLRIALPASKVSR